MENECDGLHGFAFVISHYERYTVGNGRRSAATLQRKVPCGATSAFRI